MREIGRVISETLADGYDDRKRSDLFERTRTLMERYPLYSHLSAAV
jgi:hypothetical protein